jgi:glycosyltransferase involved in cell wall biosynthesis
MKVLWITNMLFPEANNILLKSNELLKDSGGWLLSSSNGLINKGNIDLVVASVSSYVKRLTRIPGEKVIYYALPCKNERKYNSSYEGFWKEIVDFEKPDFVHIHGTEFSHGLAFLNSKISIPTILSMQGVVSSIGQYFIDGLDRSMIIKCTSFFDFFYAGTLFKQKRKYIKHGLIVEKEMLKKAHYIIGRTKFDRAWVLSLNPRAKYIVCNETLREEFYEGRWSFGKCIKHSIFISQAGYSVKGFHMVLKALPAIKAKYPDVKIKIAGNDITKNLTLKSKIIKSSYSRIISQMVKKLNLTSSIEFLGPLNASRMKEEYLKANLFLCSSSIENSPNSLGEAQILGVPCVASFVGGIPDFIPNSNCGRLYRFDDVPMLVQSISDVFEESNVFDNTIMITEATKRHNFQFNLDTLISIYKKELFNGISK